MSLVLNGSGTITGLSAGGLPDATITQAEIGTNVAGTGPAFLAYASANTPLSATTDTKIAHATEVFDTGGCFNNTGSTVTLNGLSVPSYSFCPNIAGYYQVTASWTTSSTAAQYMYSALYKNGVTYVLGAFVQTNGPGGVCSVTALVYLNGTGDYLSHYALDSIAVNTTTGQQYTSFQGAMVRAA